MLLLIHWALETEKHIVALFHSFPMLTLFHVNILPLSPFLSFLPFNFFPPLLSFVLLFIHYLCLYFCISASIVLILLFLTPDNMTSSLII